MGCAFTRFEFFSEATHSALKVSLKQVEKVIITSGTNTHHHQQQSVAIIFVLLLQLLFHHTCFFNKVSIECSLKQKITHFRKTKSLSLFHQTQHPHQQQHNIMVDRKTLARATESTTSPTPGYLYNDIAKSSATSPSASSEIVSYLIKRLESKNNPNIKYKCLKTIQMVSTHPASRGMFKRCIVQDVNAVSVIKSCLGYRGPPDAIHGDTLYEKVRNQAKETLDAVYSDDPSSNDVMANRGGMGSMGSSQGYGGYGFGGGGSAGYGGASTSSMPSSSSAMGGGGPKKMEGIGNPMFADPRVNARKDIGEMTVSDVLSGVKEGFVGMIKDPLARNISGASHTKPGSMGGSIYGGPRPANGVSGFWKF